MPALFADAAVTAGDVLAHPVGQAGIGFFALTTAASVVTLLINRRFDARLVSMEAKLKACEDKHAEADERHRENAAEIAQLKAEAADLRAEKDDERTAKHRAVQQKTAVAYRLAIIEELFRQKFPELKLPEYRDDDDAGHTPAND